MPNWKYNPRTGMMEPVERTGVSLYKVMGGLKVEDLGRKFSFIIMRNSDTIQYTAGFDIRRRGVHLFSHPESVRIAQTVMRLMPGSKYTDWRWFYVDCADPSDDTEPVEESTINEDDYADVATAQSTQGNTDFAKPNSDRRKGKITSGGLGALRAALSFAISTLISWPVMLVNLIGSYHIRSQEHWKHSLFNPNNWKDFIQTPRDKKGKKMDQREFDKLPQNEKDAYLNDSLKENFRFFYVTVDNGDVFLIPATRPADAKEVCHVMVQKLIENKYYENMRRRINEGGGMYTIYRVQLDNGEILWECETNRNKAMNNARKSRKEMHKFYKECRRLFLKQDEWRNHPLYRGTMVDPDKLPQAQDAEDFGQITIEDPSTNINTFRVGTSPIDIINGAQGDTYRFEEFINFALSIRADGAPNAAEIVKRVVTDKLFADFVDEQERALRNHGDIVEYYAETQFGDKFIFPISDAWLSDHYKTELNKFEKEHNGNIGDAMDELRDWYMTDFINKLERLITNKSQSVLSADKYRKFCGERDFRIRGKIRLMDPSDDDMKSGLEYRTNHAFQCKRDTKVAVYNHENTGDAIREPVEVKVA